MRSERGSDGRTMVALARRFGDAIRAGDGPAAERVVEDGLDAGISPEALQVLVIEPAMVRIGELWQRGVITVADEHLATAISERALLRLFRTMSRRRSRADSRERILLAGPQGQHHILGLRMVADVLESAGFEVLFLGANVPVADLTAFAERHRPDVIGLTLGIAPEIAVLAGVLCELHAAVPDARIMLGGQAVPPGLRAVGYPFVESSMDVVAVVETLVAGSPQPLPRVVEMMRDATTKLLIGRREDHVETDHVAAGLAASANGAMDLAREQVRRAEGYRDLAYRDPLTDLPNRRAFEEHLAELVAAASGGALLTIDVDRFKSVNDEHGHAAGDRVLRAVAHAIGGALRVDDTAARIGGDEFAVLLPGAPTGSATRVAERIRRAVAADADADAPVTVSIGVAPLATDPRGALLAADVALYAAKAAGRDHITVHDAPVTDAPSGAGSGSLLAAAPGAAGVGAAGPRDPLEPPRDRDVDAAVDVLVEDVVGLDADEERDREPVEVAEQDDDRREPAVDGLVVGDLAQIGRERERRDEP